MTQLSIKLNDADVEHVLKFVERGYEEMTKGSHLHMFNEYWNARTAFVCGVTRARHERKVAAVEAALSIERANAEVLVKALAAP